jgi:hypothetical protein
MQRTRRNNLQVPPIATIDASPAHLHEGAYAMRSSMYLPAAATAAIAAYKPPAQSAGLPHLAAHLQTHGTVYGAILPPGAYDLSALLPQRYVQQHMLYSAKTQRRLETYTRASGDAADTITALLQVRAPAVAVLCCICVLFAVR